jgi:hypothetical protein
MGNRAKTEAMADGVEKDVAMDKEKINAERDVTMLGENGRRYNSGLESWGTGGGGALGGLALDGGNVGTVNI